MRMPVAIGVGAAFWLVLAWAFPPFAKLTPHKTLALQLILTFAGLVICAVVFWYFKRRQPAQQAPEERIRTDASEPVVPIGSVLKEAQVKLASSALGRGARFSKMPMIFVIGSNGSAKTTTVVQSGLEPELLAGQVHQDGLVVPTAAGNAWLAQNAVLLEIGPGIQADPHTWHTISRQIQAGKLQSAIGKSEAVPRAVVVCYECENLLKPGATEAAAEAGKAIRSELYELSKGLGSNLPVYVLFTKLDRVAFFFDFVRNFDGEETRQILGATLTSEKAPSGVYGEREAARLTEAFGELTVSLSNRRTELLTREGDSEVILSAYEFPREFRKLRAAAVKFLLEVCRPSQLNIGPFLRGFYFSGVRPVLVSEEIATQLDVAAQGKRGQSANPDATSIFTYQRSSLQVEPEPAAFRATQRRVPEWVFLPGFFRDVVLSDRSGLAASASSTKINFPRRLLLACVTALCLLLGIATFFSYLGNRELLNKIQRAAAGVASDKTVTAEAAPIDSLMKLDSLRESLVELTDYQRTHPPLSLRWGLYTGSEVLPDARRIYFARFRTLLFNDVEGGLLKAMRSWPATPGAQANYGFAYNTLKAYLETTSNHEKATMQFLPPLLQERWASAGTVDPNKVALARRQFDFYTSELMRENPYSVSTDAAAVAKARQYLAQFAGIARVYQAMLTEANQNVKPIIFNRQFPGSSAVILNNMEVRGAFTKPGFAFVENAIKNPAQFVTGERWVLGEQGSMAANTPNLAGQIETLYDQDYINAWREYLKKSIVLRYASLGDAVRKLNMTSSPQSPLLALFWLASQNTNVAAPAVQQAFKPLHVLMPPTSVDQYVGPTNANYMTSLTTLQSAIDQASKLPPDQSQTAADQTGNAASAALLIAKQTALTLGLDADAHIEATMQKLLTDPITYVEAVKPNGASPAPLNAAGADFCSKYHLLSSKFPFDPNAKTKASLEDVNAVFRPQQGSLWQFYEAKLSKMLIRQGSTYVPAAGQKPEVTGRFVNFFNNAARFSNALYANGTSQEPKLVFALEPALSSDIQSVAVTINGQSADLQPHSGSKQFSWPGNGGGVRLVAKSGTDFTYPNYDGTWGLFEFFDDADKPLPSPEWMLKAGRSDKPVTSPLTNQPITVHLNVDMLGAPPVFQKGYFRELTCVAEVAR